MSLDRSPNERQVVWGWIESAANHRPDWGVLVLFGVAYVAAAGVAQSLAFIPATGISIWPPSGLFVAVLATCRAVTWPWWVLVAFLAEMSCNSIWFHNAMPVALGVFAGNALEAVLGALLLGRFRRRPFRLVTLKDVLALLVLGAAVAPMLATMVGAVTLSAAGLQPFFRAWLLLWVGDATGVLIVAPLVLEILRWRQSRSDHSGTTIELLALVALLALGSGVSFSGYLPFAYITMPALLWAAVRFEFKGAAIGIIVVTTLTVLFAAFGFGPFVGDPETQTLRHVMLQLYLAISALTTLVVAAISRQNREAIAALEQSNEDLEQRIADRTSKLSESQARYRNIFESVGVSIWEEDFSEVAQELRALRARGVSDLRTYLADHPDMIRSLLARVRINDVNNFTLGLYGVTGKQELMSSLVPYFEDLRFFAEELFAIWDGQTHLTSERRLKTPSGKMIDVMFTVVYAGENASRAIVSLVDITDRKRTEESLRASEARMQLAMHAGKAATWDLDLVTGRNVWSASHSEMLGIPPTQSIEATEDDMWRQAIHRDDKPAVMAEWQRAQEARDILSSEHRIRRRDTNEVVWVKVSGRFVYDEKGRPVRFLGIFFDITERKIIEERLQYQLKLNRNITDTIPVSIFVNDADGNIAFVNPEVERVFGFSLGDLQGKSLHEIIHYKHRDGRPFPIEECPMGFVYEHGQGIRDYETVFWRKDGRPVEVVCSSVPITQGGKAVGDVIAVVDVTERRRNEQALAVAAERTAIAQDAADAWTYEYRPADGSIERSGAFQEVTGYAPEDFAAADELREKIHPEDVVAAWQGILKGQSSDGYSLDYRLRHKDGHYIWVHDQARVLKGIDGRPDRVIGMTFDITDQKRGEQQMQLLMREVNHRAKNILGLVQAIARQTAASEPEDFVARFSDRIRALAANQDLLIANAWQGVDLESLIRAQLAPFADLIGNRISVSGMPVRLTPGAAQSIGLALHELATNAGKYGALASEDGCVEVQWSRTESKFAMSWTEHTTHPVHPPTRLGFGTTVIATMAKLSVDGEVRIEYAPTGLVWQLDCPVQKAVEDT